MRYVDAEAGVGRGGPQNPVALDPGDGDGEPPIDIAVPTTRELFAELERRLAGVRVLRVVGREWLTGDVFRREVESRIESFRRRGGRVE